MIDKRFLGRLVDELMVGLLISPLLFFAGLIAGLSHIAVDKHEAQLTSWKIVTVAVFAAVLYEVLTTRAGAGVGKLMYGLVVVDATSGRRLSWRQSLVRGTLVSLQPQFWLWIALGGSKSLHARVLFWGVAAVFVAWRCY